MSDRVTKATLDARCANVNRRLIGTGRGVVCESRNGHTVLDEYEVKGDFGSYRFTACLNTITVGTKGEVAEFLHAMMVGIDMSRGLAT